MRQQQVELDRVDDEAYRHIDIAQTTRQRDDATLLPSRLLPKLPGEEARKPLLHIPGDKVTRYALKHPGKRDGFARLGFTTHAEATTPGDPAVLMRFRQSVKSIERQIYTQAETSLAIKQEAPEPNPHPVGPKAVRRAETRKRKAEDFASRESQYGKKYQIDLDLVGPTGEAERFKTGWIVPPHASSEVASLVTLMRTDEEKNE